MLCSERVPVGSWIARTLADRGHAVRAVNRSGKRGEFVPAEVEIVSADLSDAQQAIEAASGATVLYQALNPPYDKWHELFPGCSARRWQRRRRRELATFPSTTSTCTTPRQGRSPSRRGGARVDEGRAARRYG